MGWYREGFNLTFWALCNIKICLLLFHHMDFICCEFLVPIIMPSPLE